MGVEIIKGGSFTDARGTLQFVNDFDFYGVKRFYQIKHDDKDVVRAWQGHQIEHKWFFVGTGTFIIAWVQIDNWQNPSTNLNGNYVILSEESPKILSVPKGYANGIKALSPGSILTVYSDSTVEQSSNDRWSFDPALWLDWSAF